MKVMGCLPIGLLAFLTAVLMFLIKVQKIQAGVSFFLQQLTFGKLLTGGGSHV